jgi:hypothetical protein
VVIRFTDCMRCRDAAFPVSEMIRGEGALPKDPETGLYDFGNEEGMEGIGDQMSDFRLPLTLGGGNGNGSASAAAGMWGTGYKPVINFRFVFLLHFLESPELTRFISTLPVRNTSPTMRCANVSGVNTSSNTTRTTLVVSHTSN